VELLFSVKEFEVQVKVQVFGRHDFTFQLQKLLVASGAVTFQI
jgi:hypothetical protein